MSELPVRPRGRPRTSEEPSTVVALERAVTLMRLIAEHDGLTVSELVELSGQPLASAFRALTTLQAQGMVESQDMRFHIGPDAFLLGSAFLKRSNLATLAARDMAVLRDEYGETVTLFVASGTEAFCLAETEGNYPLRANLPPGSRVPLHASAPGKALLAWGGAMPGTLAKYTSLTITAPSALERDLLRVRERGFALDDQESVEGMRAVAAPVYDADGRAVAALALSAPAFRMTLSEAQRAGAELRTMANRLTAATAGTPPDQASSATRA